MKLRPSANQRAAKQASDAATLLQLDAQIEEAAGLDAPALEELRVKRRQQAKKIADTSRRLAVRAGPLLFPGRAKQRSVVSWLEIL